MRSRDTERGLMSIEFRDATSGVWGVRFREDPYGIRVHADDDQALSHDQADDLEEFLRDSRLRRTKAKHQGGAL